MTVKTTTPEERDLMRLQKKKIEMENLNILSESAKEEEYNQIDNEIATALDNVNTASYKKEIKYILDTKKMKGKSAATFTLKEYVLGAKNNSTRSHRSRRSNYGHYCGLTRRNKESSFDLLYELTKEKP